MDGRARSGGVGLQSRRHPRSRRRRCSPLARPVGMRWQSQHGLPVRRHLHADAGRRNDLSRWRRGNDHPDRDPGHRYEPRLRRNVNLLDELSRLRRTRLQRARERWCGVHGRGGSGVGRVPRGRRRQCLLPRAVRWLLPQPEGRRRVADARHAHGRAGLCVHSLWRQRVLDGGRRRREDRTGSGRSDDRARDLGATGAVPVPPKSR